MHARRFLHCCYCTSDLDATTAFLAGAFGLQVGMRTSGERASGAILGLDREVEACAAFVFDARGPRTSPAIEVSGWVDPPATGAPYAAPNEIGIQAIGLAVGDRAAALANAVAHGAVAQGPSALRDPGGVRFDLVETSGATQLHHFRVTCRDLDRSVAWYEGIGFRGEPVTDRGNVRTARLTLPDEPTALLLDEWTLPKSTGTPYAVPYHRGLYRIALAVDDTRNAVRALTAIGYPIERAPMRVELPGTRVPEMWIAFLHDPDGIPIELVERPRRAFR